MKKTLATFIACLAFAQSIYAIPSNLEESIREQQAILNAQNLLETEIAQNEFITALIRITQEINTSPVFYEITTHTERRGDGRSGDIEALDSIARDEPNEMARSHRRHRQDLVKKYRVELVLIPNPQIGPPIIQVVSIEPISRNNREFFE